MYLSLVRYLQQIHDNTLVNMIHEFVFSRCDLFNFLIQSDKVQYRRYMAEILPIRRKTLINQSINQYPIPEKVLMPYQKC